MPFGVKITRAIPLFPLGTFLQWDLTDPLETGSYIFDVYRGGASDGPWIPLLLGGINVLNYLDRIPVGQSNDVNQLSLARGIYYRIVATPPSGSGNAAEVVSIVEPNLDGRQRLLKRKILRDESVMLKRLNGVKVAVCKRMHWGPRCTKCYDKYTKDVVRANCTTCLGTGFIPGYYTPIITWARRLPATPAVSITPQGKSDITVTRATLLDIPQVQDDDVLVFLADNRRFQVKQVTTTELKTVTVHQVVVVSELARSSIEYRITVDPIHLPALF